MNGNEPVRLPTPMFADLTVVPTRGEIYYTDLKGKPQKFVFQCNPTTLTRSRRITRTESKATNPTAGSKKTAGQAGRKFTHKADEWRFESLELWFDASMPFPTPPGGLAGVQAGIEHLEAICEPGPEPSENESQIGAPPAPSPPEITLNLGNRSWKCFVNSVTILEKEFTPALVPRLVKATLSLELMPDERDNDNRKPGAKR
jgi:hypothetical protein